MNDTIIGLALGSGSARGLAHIGVIRALAELGIRPGVVCGTSVGALVAAALACDQLDRLEERVANLRLRSLFRYFDPRFLKRGGFLSGDAVEELFRDVIKEQDIGALPVRFGAIATDLLTGERIEYTQGDLWHAVRASMSLPGFLPPMKDGKRWLVDGGLVEPVPVSLCRTLGAEVVIGVNLNSDIAGKHIRPDISTWQSRLQAIRESDFFKWLPDDFRGWADNILSEEKEEAVQPPDIFDALASSINIMQQQITAHSLEENPPEILLTPKLSSIGLLDFEQSNKAIQEGAACVERAKETIAQAISGAQ